MVQRLLVALVVWLAVPVFAIAGQERRPTLTDDQITAPVLPSQTRLVDLRRPDLALPPIANRPPRAQHGTSRDTLANGALIGAVAGAAGAAAFAALVCHVYQEEGAPSCWPDTLRGAAIGAAIGVGAGVTLDAAFTRKAGGVVRVGVSF
jgi:hypothetical protein